MVEEGVALEGPRVGPMESKQDQALPGKACQAAAGWECSASKVQFPLAEPQRRGPDELDFKVQPWCHDTLSPVLRTPTFSVGWPGPNQEIPWNGLPSLEPGNGQQGS